MPPACPETFSNHTSRGCHAVGGGTELDACQFVVSGFAEDFDAPTGVGLWDRAYTWTAVDLLVLHTHARLVKPAQWVGRKVEAKDI